MQCFESRMMKCFFKKNYGWSILGHQKVNLTTLQHSIGIYLKVKMESL